MGKYTVKISEGAELDLSAIYDDEKLTVDVLTFRRGTRNRPPRFFR